MWLRWGQGVAVGVSLMCSLACGERDPGASGLDAWMSVQGASFRAGEMPSGDGSARVESLQLENNLIQRNSVGKRLQGSLSGDGSALLLGLQGDVGFWVARAGLPQPDVPGLPGFSLDLSFSTELPAGVHVLQARAVDADGQFGPLSTRELRSDQRAPVGALVIRLTWDTEADLDLHVVTPDGVEIYKGAPTSFMPPPPGRPADPVELAKAGRLDFDSNASCVNDGRREENVSWGAEPVAGLYTIRVDTPSLCTASYAYWRVDAWLAGRHLDAATGVATHSDTRFAHGRGAGVLALELGVP